jgi:hypothetical protein
MPPSSGGIYSIGPNKLVPVSGDRDTKFQRLDPPEIGPSPFDVVQLSRFVVFSIRTGRWIMSRNTMLILTYHRHKLLDFNCVKRSLLTLLHFDLLSWNLPTGPEENQRNLQTG